MPNLHHSHVTFDRQARIGKPLLLNFFTVAGSGKDQTRLSKQEGSTLPADVDPFIAPGRKRQIIVHSSYLQKGYMGFACPGKAEPAEQQFAASEIAFRNDSHA
jgi:hypothetical protein